MSDSGDLRSGLFCVQEIVIKSRMTALRNDQTAKSIHCSHFQNHLSLKGLKGIMGHIGKGREFLGAPDSRKFRLNSGDFGLKNLRLDTAVSFTSFDDSTDDIASSGHLRDYSMTLSGDISETDRLAISINSTRYESGGSNALLSRSLGSTITWQHSLNDNFDFGLFFLWNEVDTEEVNGNSHSYAYGPTFSSFHSLGFVDISTVTSVAYVDFDTGYDLLFLSTLTLSKQFNDSLGGYLSLSFQDSWKKDPDYDPTYGSWEIGLIYIINENLSLGLAYSRTEFLNNYNDNTLLFNIAWNF